MKPRANARQARREDAARTELWCSWGRHHTWKHSYLKQQYSGGTICMACQVEIAEGLEKVVYMPEMSEAMYRHARARYEANRGEAAYDAYLHAKVPDADGIVYYILINGQIKIGYTANLKRRSRSYPPGSELLAIEPGTKMLERERHIQFARFLARGREWFADAPEIRKHAASLVEQFGMPKKMMHRYTEHRVRGDVHA